LKSSQTMSSKEVSLYLYFEQPFQMEDYQQMKPKYHYLSEAYQVSNITPINRYFIVEFATRAQNTRN
jgi:hypothetical protein